MKRMKLFFVCLLYIPFILQAQDSSAKSTPEHKFEEITIPEGKAAVYFYQPANFEYWAHLIYSESGPVCILRSQSYFVSTIDPGTITFWIASQNLKDITLNAADGESYFIKISYPLLPANTIDVKIVPARKARTEIRSCRLSKEF
jgi:hypothetical protein